MLAGLVNIRGELHLCVRLDQLLGIAAAAGGKDDSGSDAATSARRHAARLLVVRRQGEAWVLPVDEVDQVHRFSTRDLGNVPATLARAATRLTRGLVTWQGRSIGYLDDARLFQTLRTRIR
jgi:chemotaxis-related protein WspD